MSASKVLDLAVEQGLLDAKVISELRKQIAESKFVVTPEAIAKVLVDHGHLTPFQARKLVNSAVGTDGPAAEAAKAPPAAAPPAAGQTRRDLPGPPCDRREPSSCGVASQAWAALTLRAARRAQGPRAARSAAPRPAPRAGRR